MNILNVKFEKPYHRFTEGDPEVMWNFQAETDENMPHGHPVYAGELRKTAEGWQARPYSVKEWSAVGRSRMDALVNNLPFQLRHFQEWQDAQKVRETAEGTRRNVALDMNAGLPEGIRVRATNVEAINEPLKFTITIENLTEAGAKKWAGILR